MGWLHDLSTGGLAVVVFAASYLVAAAIFVVVTALAKGRRGEAFKAVSSGLLPPMGLLFGLLVGFLAAQVWSNADRAQLAVDREASALRSVDLLMDAFPGEPDVEAHIYTEDSAETDAERKRKRKLHEDADGDELGRKRK